MLSAWNRKSKGQGGITRVSSEQGQAQFAFHENSLDFGADTADNLIFHYRHVYKYTSRELTRPNVYKASREGLTRKLQAG